MSNYENAPATKLLATHCAACARPLVDATSVEIGMGPDCRAKYFKDDAAFADNRPTANAIVYRIALAASSGDCIDPADINALRLLGFDKLADKLVKRTCKISIALDGDRYVVKTPYTDDSARAWRSIPGRRWDAANKVNVVPATSREPLWNFLRTWYQGQMASGPKGVFTV